MLMSQKSPDCIDTIVFEKLTGSAVLALWQQTLKATVVWIAATLSYVFIFIERERQRQALSKLDDRLLEDIGVSRLAAQHESQKPFWKK